MFEFTDRVPASGKANRKKITHSDGSVEYVTIENADDANPVGTPLNKATFEAMQTAVMPVAGSYVGNGEAYREIELDFEPLAVILLNAVVRYDNYPQTPIFILTQNYSFYNGSLSGNKIIHDASKQASGDYIYMNGADQTYYYIALKGVIK